MDMLVELHGAPTGITGVPSCYLGMPFILDGAAKNPNGEPTNRDGDRFYLNGTPSA